MTVAQVAAAAFLECVSPGHARGPQIEPFGKAPSWRKLWEQCMRFALAACAPPSTVVEECLAGGVDCGSAFNGWQQKCVQLTLLRLMRGQPHLARRVRGQLATLCRNHAGCGKGLGVEAEHNLCAVQRVLQEAGLFAWVVGALSATVVRNAHVFGRWCLGAPRGRCIGALL